MDGSLSILGLDAQQGGRVAYPAVHLASGWEVVVVDNLSKSSKVTLDRLLDLAPGDLRLHEVDVLDDDAGDRR